MYGNNIEAVTLKIAMYIHSMNGTPLYWLMSEWSSLGQVIDTSVLAVHSNV